MIKDKLFIALQYIVPQHLLSRVVGWLAQTDITWIKSPLINAFIKQFHVDMSLAKFPDPSSYKTFNDFFTRELNTDARPVNHEPGIVISPADGAISQIGYITENKILQAKGHDYTVNELLGGDSALSQAFINGVFSTIYLSPKDYHRLHMPIDGTLRTMIHIPGDLFSVNTATAQHVPRLFARNERVVAIFDTEVGPMALVLVGAMIVASIETVWGGQITPTGRSIQTTHYSTDSESEPTKPITLKKGDEMGRFKLGSTIIVCFGEHVVDWLTTFSEGTPILMGEILGKIKH